MKKIFTLFMATVVALSVMALPHKTLKVDTKISKKDLPATVERKVSDTPLQQAAAKTTKTQKFLRDFTRAKQAPATSSMKKVVAAQAADTVYYSFDSFQQGPEYYEEYGDWYIAVGDLTCGMRFDWYADDVVGTFTTEDMEYEWSYMWYLNDWDEEVYVEYVDITLTVEKVTGKGGNRTHHKTGFRAESNTTEHNDSKNSLKIWNWNRRTAYDSNSTHHRNDHQFSCLRMSSLKCHKKRNH